MARSAPEPAPMLSVFGSISGGSFAQFNVQGIPKGGFEYLQEAVAPAAFHNSGERFDPPRCHENTRIAILKKIMDWTLSQDPETKNALIMWLRGAAGVGKSAIAQTIAELCYENNLLLASFFFCRSDSTRNNGRSLVATIAYQVWSVIPSVRESIIRAIEGDPLIFTRSLITQLTVLVVEPLQDLFQSGQFSGPDARRLILIDGLDECLDHQVQRNILDTISKAIHLLHVPLIFLVASRSEPDISAAFYSKAMLCILTEISLDDLDSPDQDIELFLRDTFKEIRQTHRFKKFIPIRWPTDEVIQTLVRKSSGQFIYAATVARYVQPNRHRPDKRLEVILSLRPVQSDMPFAELDALYTQILSSVADIDKILDVLSFYIKYNGRHWSHSNLEDENKFRDSGMDLHAVENIFSFGHGDIQLLFCDLGSVVSLAEVKGREELRMLHASFGDFLLDQSRSSRFRVDFPRRIIMHARKCIRLLRYSSLTDDYAAASLAMEFLVYTVYIRELHDDFLDFPISHIYETGSTDLIKSFNIVVLSALLHAMDHHDLEFEDASWHLRGHFLSSFDKVLTRHLEVYYADMRLTLLVGMVYFVRSKRTGDVPEGDALSQLRFQEQFQLFDLDPVLLDTDRRCCSIFGKRDRWKYLQYLQYLEFLSDFFDDPARSGSYAMNGEDFANSALCSLIYLCNHHSLPQTLPRQCTKDDIDIRRNSPWMWLVKGKHGVLAKSRFWTKNKAAIQSIYTSSNISKDMVNPAVANRVWSSKYAFGLEYLKYFLPRSARSEEVIKFASQHTFAPRSQEFSYLSRRSRAAIAIVSYLKRMDSEE